MSDSGGPLVYELDNMPLLVGVLSFSNRNCASRGYPDVFTKIIGHKKWIYGEATKWLVSDDQFTIYITVIFKCYIFRRQSYNKRP